MGKSRIRNRGCKSSACSAAGGSTSQPRSRVAVGVARGPLLAPAQEESKQPVHDPLEAVVTWFESGETTAAFVALDLGLLSYAKGYALRAAIGASCGLPADSIILHYTHTHTGARGKELEGLSERLSALAAEARRRARPAQMAYAEVDTGGRFNFNRRKRLPCGLGSLSVFLGMEDSGGKPDGGCQNRVRLQKWLGRPAIEPELLGPMLYDAPVDSLLQAVFFRSPDGEPIGSLVRFACHPTPAAHTTQRMQSADFPTVVRQRLREAFGGECGYLTGPSGNVAPWEKGDWVYNDPTPQEDPETFDPGVLWWIRQRDPPQAWSEMDRIGNGLADAIIPHIPDARVFRSLTSFNLTIDRPVLPLVEDVAQSLEEARRLRIEACKRFFDMRAPASLAELKAMSDRVCHLHLASHWGNIYGLTDEQRSKRQTTVELPALRLNDVVLMGFPGETFWETPQKARRAAEQRGLRYVSTTLANGSIGYIPTEAERPLGDYEAHSTILAECAEARLEAAAGAHAIFS